MKRILPLTVTTYEALCICIKSRAKLIYFPYEFYIVDLQRICLLMSKHRYKVAEIPAQRGVFYIKKPGTGKYYVSDPYGIY